MTPSGPIRLDESPRVLVTGAAGFVGSNLARALVDRGVEVHGLVRTTSCLGRIEDVLPRLSLHRGDVRHPDEVALVMDRVRPEAIVHTAIQGVDRRRQDRAEMIATNVVAAHHLVACARGSGCRRVVVTGGSSEYGRRPAPMNEDAPPRASQLLRGHQGRRHPSLPAGGPGERLPGGDPAAVLRVRVRRARASPDPQRHPGGARR